MQSSTTKHMLLGSEEKGKLAIYDPNEKTRTNHVTKGKSCHIMRKKQIDVTFITLRKAKQAKTILKAHHLEGSHFFQRQSHQK